MENYMYLYMLMYIPGTAPLETPKANTITVQTGTRAHFPTPCAVLRQSMRAQRFRSSTSGCSASARSASSLAGSAPAYAPPMQCPRHPTRALCGVRY
eukprot:1235712-Rhodomonas_salina.4